MSLPQTLAVLAGATIIGLIDHRGLIVSTTVGLLVGSGWSLRVHPPRAATA